MSSLKTYFRYLTHEDRVRCQIELEKNQVKKFIEISRKPRSVNGDECRFWIGI